MFYCNDCGRVLRGEFWYRRNYLGIEYYCDRCAFSHMDDHGQFGLMLTTEAVEKLREDKNGKNV